MNCGTRFYDFDKTPIICPSCETEFTGDVKVKSRRGRPAATPEAPVKKVEAEVEEDDIEDIDADDDVVSLDDMDDEDDAPISANDEDDADDQDLAALDDNFDDIDDEEEDLDEEEEEKS